MNTQSTFTLTSSQAIAILNISKGMTRLAGIQAILQFLRLINPDATLLDAKLIFENMSDKFFSMPYNNGEYVHTRNFYLAVWNGTYMLMAGEK